MRPMAMLAEEKAARMKQDGWWIGLHVGVVDLATNAPDGENYHVRHMSRDVWIHTHLDRAEMHYLFRKLQAERAAG